MRIFTVLILLLSAVTCRKIFGPFFIKLEDVKHPAPKNDVVNYYFRINKLKRDQERISGKLEFFRRVEDLKVSIEMMRKNKDSKVNDYTVLYPRQAEKSFCAPDNAYPVLKASFQPPMDEENCSLNEGIYDIVNYDIEKELKSYIGDESHYMGVKTTFYFTEGTTNETIVQFEIYYKHLPIVPKKNKS